MKTALTSLELLARELDKYKCFFFCDGGSVGPTSLWQVREKVEMRALDEEVPVILEGTDFWYPYSDQERRVAPWATKYGLSTARDPTPSWFYYYGDVGGPITKHALSQKICREELPNDVQVCAVGSEIWRCAWDVLRVLDSSPKSSFRSL